MVQQLAAFAKRTSYEDLSEEVRSSVRSRVLDTLGNCLAALPLDTSVAIRNYISSQGGREQAHAIGIMRPVPAASAAMVNGVLAHSLDFDDTHLPSILHPSASVIPASLAAAEASGTNGRDLVRAIAVGLEICVRLGMAGYDREARNSLFFERGQHATSICGTVAGAAAAALVLGATEVQIAHSMGVAVSMASGVLEGNRAGGTVKRLHCGWAAHAAVTSAELALAGFTGPPTALEGRFGFFEAFIGGKFDQSQITDGLGLRWEVPRIFFKPYPCNHFTHAGIDAALRLKEKGLRSKDVAAMHLGVAAPTVRTIGEPIEIKRRPETGYQAQFSGPYAVAAALLGGGGLGLWLDDFTDEAARDPNRRELMARISVEPDAECLAVYPNQFPAVLRVTTRQGAEFIERVMANRGGPDRPLSHEDLATKFRLNAKRVLDEDAVEEMEDAVKRLEVLEDAGELLGPRHLDTRSELRDRPGPGSGVAGVAE